MYMYIHRERYIYIYIYIYIRVLPDPLAALYFWAPVWGPRESLQRGLRITMSTMTSAGGFQWTVNGVFQRMFTFVTFNFFYHGV